ncbi:MAG: heme exporter protein C [Myxococcota bacterium]|jgi:heme exporter protein C
MKIYHYIGILGIILLTVGHYMGLFVAPGEAMMQNVGRILYVHVPTAWIALVCYLIAFGAAIGALWTGRRGWDATVEASIEVGVLLTALLLFQGSVWGRPTWGEWWSWDPRLTTSAVLLIAFAVILLLRSIIEQPDRRLLVSSVATIIAFVDVPIVYYAADWWNSLHQNHSSPDTVSSTMVLPLRISAFGMLFLALGFIGARRAIALKRLEAEDAPEALPPEREPLILNEETS